MDLKHLIDFLPYSYKARDTYKVDGKGILERFLELFGTYMEDIIVPEIDTILDNITIDKAENYYLNYLWEFLGELPFGYSVLIDKDKWDTHYDPTDSAATYNIKKKLWEITKSGYIILSESTTRTLLKYAVTLIKVRGTPKFFDAIFRLYNLQCTINDPVKSVYYDSVNGVSYIPSRSSNPYDYNYFDSETTFDSDLNYDLQYIPCTQCFGVDIDISPSGGPFAGKEKTIFADIQGIYIYGKSYSTTDIIEGVNDYVAGKTTWRTSALKAFKATLEVFFDKYLPFNAKINKLTFLETEIN